MFYICVICTRHEDTEYATTDGMSFNRMDAQVFDSLTDEVKQRADQIAKRFPRRDVIVFERDFLPHFDKDGRLPEKCKVAYDATMHPAGRLT